MRWDVEDEWETDDSEDEQDGEGMPSYEFRVETAKLLIELDEDNHAAVQVRFMPPVATLPAHVVMQPLAHQCLRGLWRRQSGVRILLKLLATQLHCDAWGIGLARRTLNAMPAHAMLMLCWTC